MAIAYTATGQQVGVATETSGAALSPLCPSTVNAGDILIAHVYFEGTATTPSTPSGWTLLDGPRVIETTIGRHWIFGKVADGSEDSSAVAFGTPAVTTMRGAIIYRFTGRISGAIADLVNGFSATSHATDPQMPSVTTTAAGALAVACVVQNDNNALGAATGESGGDWTEAVPEFVAALTPGLVMQLQTCTPTANPGTVSGGAVAATNDPSGVIGFQIRDQGPQIVSPSGLTHTRAFGTASVNLTLKANSPVVHARAFGTAVLPKQGVVSWAQFQVPEAAVGAQLVTPTALVRSRAIGTPTVGVGAVAVTPGSVLHSRAIPTTHLIVIYILPSSVVHTRAFGTAKLTLGVQPPSVVHTRAIGDHTVSSIAQVIQPPSVQHGRAFGSHVVEPQRGIVSFAQFQVPVVLVLVLPSGVVHTRAIGTAIVSISSISPSSVIHTRAIGAPNIIGEQAVAPSSVVHTRAIGTAQILLDPHIAAAGLMFLWGDQDFGKIEPQGVVHTRVFGSLKVNMRLFANAPVIHARAFGTHVLGRFIIVESTVHSRAIGTAQLNQKTTPASVVHSRVIETPTVGAAVTTVTPAPTVRSRLFGSPTVTISEFDQTIFPGSVVRSRNITGPIVTRAGDAPARRQATFSAEWGVDTFHPGDIDVEVEVGG